MSQLPANAPANTGAAFAHINAITAPTVDDLKIMVFVEASAKPAYDALAETAPNAEIADLLRANGREELAHAHRCAKVIGILTGEDFPPPAPENNPYVSPGTAKVDLTMLETLVTAENGGRTLYEHWAASIGNAEAAALLLQNGKEETEHAGRAIAAIKLLP